MQALRTDFAIGSKAVAVHRRLVPPPRAFAIPAPFVRSSRRAPPRLEVPIAPIASLHEGEQQVIKALFELTRTSDVRMNDAPADSASEHFEHLSLRHAQLSEWMHSKKMCVVASSRGGGAPLILVNGQRTDSYEDYDDNQAALFASSDVNGMAQVTFENRLVCLCKGINTPRSAIA